MERARESTGLVHASGDPLSRQVISVLGVLGVLTLVPVIVKKSTA